MTKKTMHIISLTVLQFAAIPYNVPLHQYQYILRKNILINRRYRSSSSIGAYPEKRSRGRPNVRGLLRWDLSLYFFLILEGYYLICFKNAPLPNHTPSTYINSRDEHFNLILFLLITTFVVFNMFYQSIKSLILNMG